MKRRYLITIGLITFTAGLFGQSQIELPDLTTVVQGDDSVFVTAENPDFDDIITIPEGSTPLVPQLPQVQEQQAGNLINVEEKPEVKSIFAEGQIGGGYPAAFIGDFSISRITGDSPFKLGFSHRSEAGYSANPLSAGFNSKNTSISLRKDYNGKSVFWSAGGNYEDCGNGLQSLQPEIASINQQDVSLFGQLEWSLPKNLRLIARADSDIYNRYADISNSSLICEDWIKKLDVLTATPILGLVWTKNDFSVSTTARYNILSDLSGNAAGSVVNRGRFELSAGWFNKYISVATMAAAVIGNSIGNNPVLVPFTVNFSAAFPVPFSDRNVSIVMGGGMKSQLSDIRTLEKKYKFTGFNFIPSETSDWNGNITLSVPVKTMLSFNLSAVYLQTAFGNGVLEPDYVNSFNTGIYGFTVKNRQQLSTNAGLSYHYKVFSASAAFKSQWMDVPVLDVKHKLAAAVAVQSLEDKWGANVETELFFDGDDRTPVINMKGFWQLTPAVKLELNVLDFCKLVDDNSRIYAGNYISDSGSVTMLVKFLF